MKCNHGDPIRIRGSVFWCALCGAIKLRNKWHIPSYIHVQLLPKVS